MATTADYLTQLQADKQALVDNLVEKGVEATADETFTSLVPKVLDIQSGGGAEITKGIRIDGYDTNGYVNKITVLGMTELPANYLRYAGYSGAWCSGENTKVTLPNGLTKIGEYALSYFPSLTEINLPDTIYSIGDRTFYGNSNMLLEKLPASLRSSGNYAFQGCTKITIKIIPSGVTVIWMNEYSGCKGITEITCEGNISQLSSSCFSNSGLTKISFPNNTRVPSLNSNSFSGAPLERIEVPSAMLDQWKAATNWSAYADIIVGI